VKEAVRAHVLKKNVFSISNKLLKKAPRVFGALFLLAETYTFVVTLQQ